LEAIIIIMIIKVIKIIKNLLVFLVGGVIIVNLALGCWRLWQAGGKVGEAAKQLEKLKIKNEKLKSELEYVKSPEFVEKEAREKLGLGRPGEEVWILPSISANQPPISENQDKPNWERWWELFLK
jgi:cell division protein FtsB